MTLLHSQVNMTSTANVTTVTNEEFTEELLETLNSTEIHRLVPTVIYLIVIAVCGTIGNGLVCLVYGTRHRHSVSCRFVTILAAIDLLACCLVIPLEVAALIQQYSFRYIWHCKIVRFSSKFISLSTCFILLFICLDRYRKVCQPMKQQISTTVAKALCVTSPALGFILSGPYLFVYEKKTFIVDEYNITGTKCSISDSVKNTPYPLFDFVFLNVLFVSSIVVMIVLYCLIGKKIYLLAERVPRRQSRPETSLSSIYSIAMRRSMIEGNEVGAGSPDQARARKVTYTMLIITAGYLLSYVPVLSLVLVLHLDPSFKESLDGNGNATFNLFLRSYYINCTINPLIYGLLDPRFRSACKKMLASSCKVKYTSST